MARMGVEWKSEKERADEDPADRKPGEDLP
jgi:hypothetical protein